MTRRRCIRNVCRGIRGIYLQHYTSSPLTPACLDGLAKLLRSRTLENRVERSVGYVSINGLHTKWIISGVLIGVGGDELHFVVTRSHYGALALDLDRGRWI